MNRPVVCYHRVHRPCIPWNMFYMYNIQKKWASLPGLRRKHQTDLPPNAASVVRGESDILFYSSSLLIRHFSLTFLSPPSRLKFRHSFRLAPSERKRAIILSVFTLPRQNRQPDHRAFIVFRAWPQIQRKFHFRNGIAALWSKGIRR